jgi:3-deoxy-manno-octulosonate cytidylyltransferase (CMP-KDO synthetase)
LNSAETLALAYNLQLASHILVERKKKMKTAAIIPVRMGSSRFPGKPLAPICGMTMVEHIYRRVSMVEELDGVYVATCDDEIRTAVREFGGEVIMTADSHQRASDRTAEAVEKIDVDIVVMVQGDEPLTHPDMVRSAFKPLVDDPDVICSNLTCKIHSMEELRDPNTIKVVIDRAGNALYFSREPIPTVSVKDDIADAPLFKQVCIIPFRKESLIKFTELPPTPLEITESIDMLRFLEHGYKVRMIETDFETHAVDTPEDLLVVEKMMERDVLFSSYR